MSWHVKLSVRAPLEVERGDRGDSLDALRGRLDDTCCSSSRSSQTSIASQLHMARCAQMRNAAQNAHGHSAGKMEREGAIGFAALRTSVLRRGRLGGGGSFGGLDAASATRIAARQQQSGGIGSGCIDQTQCSALFLVTLTRMATQQNATIERRRARRFVATLQPDA